jgi:hypothetical protein
MKAIKLRELPLSRGTHKSAKEGACVMEVVSYVAGEKWSDHPNCACPIVSGFLRAWNDGVNDHDRQILKSFVPFLIGSRASAGVEVKRLKTIQEWLFRVATPQWLDLVGLKAEADDARTNGRKAKWSEIRASAAARADAADAAFAFYAYAAADVSASAAAHAADAADVAFASYAPDAYAAALRPTVEKLQKSALAMIHECLAIKE